MNIKGIAGMYFILAYAGCFIACIESETIYVRVLAGAYACLLTFQLLSQKNESTNDFNEYDSN